MAKWKIHPVAETYPVMDEAELDALAADIAERGLQRKIVRHQGMILDGRNRLIACEKAGVEPQFEDYEGEDPAAHARSLNLNRDLTSAQRAIVAARHLPYFKTEAERRMKAGKTLSTKGTEGQSRQHAAKHFRVGERQVQQAGTLLEEAPDLAAQVESKTLSLAAAYEQVQQRRSEADRKKKNAAKVREYADAISGGEMTMEQAIQRAIEQEQEERQKIAAEADARRNWLKEFAEHLEWFETFLFERTDEHLAWYTLPSSPGLFDHGVTPDRVQAVIGNLERASRITFGGEHERNDKKTGDTDRPNTPRRVQK